MAQQPLVDQGLLIIELHDHTQAQLLSVRLLWTSDQPVAKTIT